MKRMILMLAVTALLPVLAACASKSSSDLVLTTAFSPDPPKRGSETITVTVKDDSGNPVRGAKVSVATSMPSMSMQGQSLTAQDNSDGTYSAQASLNEVTTWQFDVKATDANGKTGTAEVRAEIK
jgi:hypothetical protein